MDMPVNTAPVAREAERLEEDVLYAEKQHFSMATVWRRIHLVIGIPSGIAAAVAGVSALNSRPMLAAGLAIISAVLTALLTFLNPEKTASAHHQAGIQYGDLRGKLRRLRLIDLGTIDSEAARRTLEALAQEKVEIMRNSPHIGGLAYRLGKASVMRGEHEHVVDRPVA